MGDIILMGRRPRFDPLVPHGTIAPLHESDFMTCDWGRCDKPAVAVRFDTHLHEWLPVCAVCRDLPPEAA